MYSYNMYSLLNCFELNCNIHDYFTRNSTNYHFPVIRTSLSLKSIFSRGPSIWNSLPDDLKKSCSLNSFKRKFKAFLIDK